MTVEHQYAYRGLEMARAFAGMRDNVVANRGNIAVLDSSGNALEGTTIALGAVTCAGRFLAKYDNTVSGHAAGFVTAQIEVGIMEWDNSAVAGNVIDATMIGKPCFVQDEHTVSATSQGNTLIAAGFITDVPMKTDGVTPNGKVAVRMSAYHSKIAQATADDSAQGGVPTSHAPVRNVMPTNFAGTNVAGVLTATSNGALATQDGVTGAVGDRVLLPGQTTAADNGVYVITSLGGASAKAVLTRAADFPTGEAYLNGTSITVSEGTLFSGSTWITRGTGALVIGTNDPKFYPECFRKTITLAAGTYTIGAGGGGEALYLFSTTTSCVSLARNTAANSTATTGGYASPVASRIAGVAGTAAVLVQAQVAAGTISNADTSTIDVLITN